MWKAGNRQAVKPSAQPTQVPILDLPPAKTAAQEHFGAPAWSLTHAAKLDAAERTDAGMSWDIRGMEARGAVTPGCVLAQAGPDLPGRCCRTRRRPLGRTCVTTRVCSA